VTFALTDSILITGADIVATVGQLIVFVGDIMKCQYCGHDLKHIGSGYYQCTLNSLKYPLSEEKYNEFLQAGLWHPACLLLQKIN